MRYAKLKVGVARDVGIPVLLLGAGCDQRSGSGSVTDPGRFDDVVTSTASFEEIIGDVLLAAARNGINPRGSWVYRNGGSQPDLEVLISELEKRDGQ